MFLILAFSFFILLLDPFGLFLGLKLPILLVIILHFLLSAKNEKFGIDQISIFFGAIVFSLTFLLKQVTLFKLNEESLVIFQTIFMFGLFFLICKKAIYLDSIYLAIKLLLMVNLVFLCIGIFRPDIAQVVNILLKNYGMFSLEMRGHYYTDYSYYHNSVYAAVVYFPKMLSDLLDNKKVTFNSFLIFLCILSLVLTQSRSVYLGLIIAISLRYYRQVFWSIPILLIFLMLYPFNNTELILDQSSLMKLGYFDAYSEQFNSLNAVIFGPGPLLVNWGLNIGSYSIIELTYLEIFRYFGLLGGALFFTTMMFLCGNLIMKKDTAVYGIGVISYILINAVNPYLWGITGLPFLAVPLSVLYYWGRKC